MEIAHCGLNVKYLLDKMINVDPVELQKFSELAHRWWDPHSEFKPLHDINPLRLGYINRIAGGLKGKRVLDVGCGGGILSEAMSAVGARVMGIDVGEKPSKRCSCCSLAKVD